MFVVKYRKIFFALSALLIVGSIISVAVFGLHFGTDFTGGSLLEVAYVNERPSHESANNSLSTLGLGNFSLRPAGERNFVLRAREITPAEKALVTNALSENGKLVIKEERFNSVGPVVGEDLKNKSYLAIAIVVICIMLFITFAFRKVSEPVASWKFGFATLVALAHDVIIPTGIYVVFGKIMGAEIDLLFITALLAILGYSVHDTIVVFDRVRENLRLNSELRIKEDFEYTVGKSVAQTFGRSINTSLTIFLTLLALLLVGSDATRDFAFTLLIGVVIGTYSSIFVGSPLLVTLEKLQKKNK